MPLVDVTFSSSTLPGNRLGLYLEISTASIVSAGDIGLNFEEHTTSNCSEPC
jgi:hypothetical protein